MHNQLRIRDKQRMFSKCLLEDTSWSYFTFIPNNSGGLGFLSYLDGLGIYLRNCLNMMVVRGGDPYPIVQRRICIHIRESKEIIRSMDWVTETKDCEVTKLLSLLPCIRSTTQLSVSMNLSILHNLHKRITQWSFLRPKTVFRSYFIL